MRKITALLLGVLLPLLAFSGVGQAQSSVQVQGTIQSVDCQAQTLILSGSGGANTIAAAPYTAVLVDTRSVAFCDLQQYTGAQATAWLVASGSEFVATRIDIIGGVVAAPAPPADPVPQAISPLPLVGIVLGTIIVAGLLYLLVRDNDDHYYRYPYYGPYYRHYYRPEYRSYYGSYPPQSPVITVAPVIVGEVLGTADEGGLQYLVTRDHDGRHYRYPYYGPYHQHYYQPGYRQYNGPYRTAPVRQGDSRWDSPAYRNIPSQNAPRYRGPGGQGVQQDIPRRTAPVYQNGPYYQNGPAYRQTPNQNAPRYRGPTDQAAPQNAPRRTAPVYQNGPYYQNGPAYRQTPNQNAPQYRGPNGQGAQQDAPRRTAPVYQNGPYYQNGPAYRQTPNQNAPRYRDPGGQTTQQPRRNSPSSSQPGGCSGQQSNQSCSGPHDPK
jgi:hypothetical protein